MARVLLDVSRLAFRPPGSTPTGIDRVELAYLSHFLAGRPGDAVFTATLGTYGPSAVTVGTARHLAEALQLAWAEGRPGPGRIARLLAWLGGPPTQPAGLYLTVAHHHLECESLVARQLARTGSRLVAYVHDTIPLDMPEYVRPISTIRHERRMATLCRHAAGVIVNSAATAAALLRRLDDRTLPILVAPPGIEPYAPANRPTPRPDEPPYFVMLGTIEARKNHLMILQVWRELIRARGIEAAPRLVIVGTRGAEAENVIDLIDRAAVLAGSIEERPGLGDRQVRELLNGARGLLMPSFAEGYGLPIAEALALGTPVLCSDLPAHREVGGRAPEYLDPLDGLAWLAAITDYADPASARRQAQLERMTGWTAPRWDAHFAKVEDFLDRL